MFSKYIHYLTESVFLFQKSKIFNQHVNSSPIPSQVKNLQNLNTLSGYRTKMITSVGISYPTPDELGSKDGGKVESFRIFAIKQSRIASCLSPYKMNPPGPHLLHRALVSKSHGGEEVWTDKISTKT